MAKDRSLDIETSISGDYLWNTARITLARWPSMMNLGFLGSLALRPNICPVSEQTRERLAREVTE
jgi:hypothetical protein